MNTRNLHYVLTVAELKSFSLAAKRLYVSQPSLSQSINTIEEEIGAKLFDRGSVPLKLTYAGERYIDAAKKILEIEKDLYQEMSDITDNRRGRITLGISTSLGQFILPIIFPVFKNEFKNIELRLVEETSNKLVEYVLDGKVDIVVSSQPDPQVSQGLKYLRVFEDDALLVAPARHELAKRSNPNFQERPPVNLWQIKDEPFILLYPGQGLRKLADSIFDLYHIKPNILMETYNFETAINLAANGMGFTFVIRLWQNLCHEHEVVCFEFDKGPVKYPLSIYYREKMYLSKPYLRLIELIQQEITNRLSKNNL